MNSQLPITWYIESPIDYEHKYYRLLGYLQLIDNEFLKKILSPHLLHLEKMHNHLVTYQKDFNDFSLKINKRRFFFIQEETQIIGSEKVYLGEIKEIVDFSIPQIKNRIDLGYKILEKNQQILF